MTDDDPREAARKELDAAITTYTVAMNAGRDDILPMAGAWVVAIYSPMTDDGCDAYLVESAPNQPWHVSIGLTRYAISHYEEDE